MLVMSRTVLQLFDAPDNLTEDQIAPLMEAHGKQLRATLTNKAVSERASFVEDILASDGGQYILVGLAADETCWGNAPWITSVCHCSSTVSVPGWLVFSSSRAVRCGSAVVDNVLGRGAGAHGKCLRGSRSGLAWSQEVIRSHSPLKGSLWVRLQPRTRFLFSCSWYKTGSPGGASRALPSTGPNAVLHFSTAKTQIGNEEACATKGFPSTAQRNRAFCNRSSW
jgi:hypothetical protein